MVNLPKQGPTPSYLQINCIFFMHLIKKGITVVSCKDSKTILKIEIPLMVHDLRDLRSL